MLWWASFTPPWGPWLCVSIFSQVWYLMLPAMASQCGSNHWDLWNTSQYGKTWGRPESTTCPALLPSSVIWSHTKAEVKCSPLAYDPACDLCDTRVVVLLLSHYLFHPWHAVLSVLFIGKHMVTAQQKVFHIEFSVVETSFRKSEILFRSAVS